MQVAVWTSSTHFQMAFNRLRDRQSPKDLPQPVRPIGRSQGLLTPNSWRVLGSVIFSDSKEPATTNSCTTANRVEGRSTAILVRESHRSKMTDIRSCFDPDILGRLGATLAILPFLAWIALQLGEPEKWGNLRRSDSSKRFVALSG